MFGMPLRSQFNGNHYWPLGSLNTCPWIQGSAPIASRPDSRLVSHHSITKAIIDRNISSLTFVLPFFLPGGMGRKPVKAICNPSPVNNFNVYDNYMDSIFHPYTCMLQ